MSRGIVSLASGGRVKYSDLTAPMKDILRIGGIDENDPDVADYLKTGGQNIDPANRWKEGWCAMGVNASMANTGQKGSGSNAARSFLDWGQPVLSPRLGDVAVSARRADDPEASPNTGHVGYYTPGYPLPPDKQGYFPVLGGNTSNTVGVAAIAPDRILGFRRPPGTDVPAGQPMAEPPVGIVGLQQQLPMSTADMRMASDPMAAVGATSAPWLNAAMEQAMPSIPMADVVNPFRFYGGGIVSLI